VLQLRGRWKQRRNLLMKNDIIISINVGMGFGYVDMKSWRDVSEKSV
jgi:hypothetical protein